MAEVNILESKQLKSRRTHTITRVRSGGRSKKISAKKLEIAQLQERNRIDQSRVTKIPLEALEESSEKVLTEKKDKNVVPLLLVKNSSVPAVSKIENAKSRFRKFLWLIILIGLFFLCAFHVYKFMHQFFQYPVIVTLKMERLNSLEFPSVTVCNLNRIQGKYTDCLKNHVTHIKNCPNLDKPQTPTSNNFKNEAAKGVSLIQSEINFLAKGKNITEEQKFLFDYYQTAENVRLDMSHLGRNFIKLCEFKGKKCSIENFIEINTLRYGKCYTFIPPEDNFYDDDSINNPSQVYRTGTEDGLRLVLDYEPEKYLNLTQVVGGRIVVSHPSEMPDPEEQGFTLSPGMETSVSLKQTVDKRLPPPYKDFCWDYAAYTEADDHSPRECRKLCIQSFNFEKCGCTNPTMSMSKGLKACNLLNLDQMHCLNEALNDLARDSSSCFCPRGCASTHYNELLSHSKYPSWNNVRRKVVNASREDLENQRCEIGAVNVYYSSFERKIFEQAPYFQGSELLSNLGGEFGLWLGMSSFALFELMEKLVSLVYFCSKKKSKNTELT